MEKNQRESHFFEMWFNVHCLGECDGELTIIIISSNGTVYLLPTFSVKLVTRERVVGY
jgi:hypothetical protein